MKKSLAAAVVLMLALAGGGLWFWQAGAGGAQAPDVPFTTLKGEQFNTADLRGKVVLVKFWATSCVTCVAQMPDNIAYQNELGGQGFEVVAVAMQYDPPQYVRHFTEDRQLPFKVVMDTTGQIASAFGDVKLTPTAFLLDRQGRIVKRYLGKYDTAEFKQTVNRLLAQAPAPVS